MDLMRMLLIYMSATLTLAVQNTAAPTETPTPSPAPETIVETAETPGPGEEAIIAVPPNQPEEATPAVKITPLPVPTITPNMKAYHNLAMGAKGKEVRRLQEKLIEMGYLPEGAADGAYGRQTYNAVKKFQYYNGLTADGIAGRKTQTNLFENPDAAPNPEVTAVPETAAPEAAETPEVTAEPASIETPETTAEPEPTEAPATETPEVTAEPEPTEAPVTATPEITAEPEPTEAPATATPEITAEPEPTEAPVTETPEITAEPEPAETPEETKAPEETETAGNAGEPEEDIPEIIENVDLDAEVYEPISAMVALNEGAGPLEFVTTEDGVPVTARPRLSRSDDRFRISLDDLCECIGNWQLTDDGVGSVVLEAAGYTLVLYSEDKGSSATVDGSGIPMREDDFDFITEGHFIDAEFLATALKGYMAWDEEENTLMLRIRDKEAVESDD